MARTWKTCENVRKLTRMHASFIQAGRNQILCAFSYTHLHAMYCTSFKSFPHLQERYSMCTFWWYNPRPIIRRDTGLIASSNFWKHLLWPNQNPRFEPKSWTGSRSDTICLLSNSFFANLHVFLRVFQSVQIVLHVFKDGLLWISGITEFYRARVLLDIYHVSVPLAPRCPESCFTITRSANKTKSRSFLNFGCFMCEKN